jgi:hypothetical protein
MPKANKPTRLEQLQADAAKVGLGVDSYSPGDGITRYKFWRLAAQRAGPPRTYFSAAPTLVTVYSYGAALGYLEAYATGYNDAREALAKALAQACTEST